MQACWSEVKRRWADGTLEEHDAQDREIGFVARPGPSTTHPRSSDGRWRA